MLEPHAGWILHWPRWNVSRPVCALVTAEIHQGSIWLASSQTDTFITTSCFNECPLSCIHAEQEHTACALLTAGLKSIPWPGVTGSNVLIKSPYVCCYYSRQWNLKSFDKCRYCALFVKEMREVEHTGREGRLGKDLKWYQFLFSFISPLWLMNSAFKKSFGLCCETTPCMCTFFVSLLKHSNNTL